MFEYEIDYDPTREGFFENVLICHWNF